VADQLCPVKLLSERAAVCRNSGRVAFSQQRLAALGRGGAENEKEQ
jgi:hypothetical protein